MTSEARRRMSLKRWSGIAGIVLGLVIAVRVFNQPDPGPPVLALHSVPFTIPAGQLPWPDRWLARGPSWNWLWALRAKVWQKNPSATLDYSLWELRDPEKLPALQSMATRTNDDWSIKVLNPEQLTTAGDALKANVNSVYSMRIALGEGIQSAMTGSFSKESYRIEAALRMRDGAVDVASAVTVSSLPAQIGGTDPMDFAFEATVPNKGAVLLLSKRSNLPRACLITVTKNP